MSRRSAHRSGLHHQRKRGHWTWRRDSSCSKPSAIPPPSASFYLDDTIISNNGLNECAIAGFLIDANGAGNLIENNDNCLGVVTAADPQLGRSKTTAASRLRWQSSQPARRGTRPTPSTSLGEDQRGQVRPAMNNLFDIGAFELCARSSACLSRHVLLPSSASWKPSH